MATERERRHSMDIQINETLVEMQKLFAKEEELSVVKSAILGIKKNIETGDKSDHVFKDLNLLKLLTMITGNSKTQEFELKATCCFLVNVFKKNQYSLQNIDKLSDQQRRYCVLTEDNDSMWSMAVGHEESLIRTNAYLTNIESASETVINTLQDNISEKEVVIFLTQLNSLANQLILQPEIKSARRATAYVNLYFKIAMLHSVILWQVFCIKSRSTYDKSSTKGVYSLIERCHNCNLSMLRCITHRNVEHAVFLSVCHITDNENVLNFLQIQGIKPFVFDEDFYAHKHSIQWVKSPDVRLQMVPRGYAVYGTTDITEECNFRLVSVKGREMDNVCYLRSEYWPKYYIQMYENGSIYAVQNIPEIGGKWKFVSLATNNEHPMFIIASIDWPGRFLYLESDRWYVRGKRNIEKVKNKGIWKICEA